MRVFLRKIIIFVILCILTMVFEPIIFIANATSATMLTEIKIDLICATLIKGEKIQLNVKAVYDDNSQKDITSDCIFETDNKTIADVNNSGLISAFEVGNVVITAVYKNLTATTKINVISNDDAIMFNSVSLTEINLNTYMLTANVFSNTNKDLTVVMGLYDCENKLENAFVKEGTINQGNNIFTWNLDGTLLDGYKIKTFLFDNLQNISPISKPIDLSVDLNSALILNQNLAVSPQKIYVCPDYIHDDFDHSNLPFFTDAHAMVDEQDKVPQEYNGKPAENAFQTEWFDGWHVVQYPLEAYIDLQKDYYLTQIALYDTYRSGKVEFYIGEPGNWTLVETDELADFLLWKVFNTSVKTRYLRVVKYNNAAMPEIGLYGVEMTDEQINSQIPIQTPMPVVQMPTPTPTITPTPTVNPTPTSQIIEKIPIKIDNIYNENQLYKFSYTNNPDTLFDEQDKVPNDYTQAPTQEFATTWDTGWWNVAYPVSAFVDLGATYKIKKIAFFDSYNVGKIEFSKGKPFAWESVFTHNLDTAMQWVVVDVDIDTQFIQIAKENNACVYEVAFYGYRTGELPNQDVKQNIKPDFGITADKAIGVNAFIDDPIDRMKVAGHVREYHNWGWDEGNGDPNYVGYPNNKNAFSPSSVSCWSFDDYYSKLANANVDPFPCIQGNVSWMLSPNYNDYEFKPIKSGGNQLDPSSYIEHADHMYQFAARYGSTPVADANLKLADNQQRLSGLGYIKYFENWNEPDKFWNGRDGYFTPYELAAMGSADYDGNEGKMGNTVGIKNADPNAKLVMPGLVGTTLLDYLKTMNVWFQYNRQDKKFVYDVINFHNYCVDSNNKALSPEAFGLKQYLASAVEWRNKNQPNKEIWLTEFGWGTNPNGNMSAPSLEAQGTWLVRGYMASFAAGIDRTTMFMLRDINPDDPSGFNSFGLVGKKGDWTPKPSWYYIYTMKNALTNMVFDSVVAEDDNVYVYKFRAYDKNSSKVCYVAWCPTPDKMTVKGYKLHIDENKTNAKLTQLQQGYITGFTNSLNIKNSAVTFNVSDSPVFITVE